MNEIIGLGKIPPQAIEIEEAVIGALLLEKNALLNITSILTTDSFYKDNNGKIYSCILELFNESKPIDLLTIIDKLRSKSILEEIGGAHYLIKLTNTVSSSANIEFHARIIAQKHIQRELIRISSEIQKRAFDDSIDIDDLLQFSESSIFEISHKNITKEAIHINEALKEAVEEIEKANNKKEELQGIPSGISKIDRITTGWQNSDLIIIAARPSMGKTAFSLNCALRAAQMFKSVLVFSLEMSTIQLTKRIISLESELTPQQLRNGDINNAEWLTLENDLAKILDIPLYIDDKPGLSLLEFKSKAKKYKLKYKIELIIIDYLQLMNNHNEQNKRGNREQEISSISRGLKIIAKELDIPIIALSQLSRNVETRSDKKPMLSDLRESGAIEQDADIVLFLHRPEKYGILQDMDGNDLTNVVNLIIAKHRNGALAEIPIKVNNSSLTKWDIDENIYMHEVENNSDYIIEPNKEF